MRLLIVLICSYNAVRIYAAKELEKCKVWDRDDIKQFFKYHYKHSINNETAYIWYTASIDNNKNLGITMY